MLRDQLRFGEFNKVCDMDSPCSQGRLSVKRSVAIAVDEDDGLVDNLTGSVSLSKRMPYPIRRLLLAAKTAI